MNTSRLATVTRLLATRRADDPPQVIAQLVREQNALRLDALRAQQRSALRVVHGEHCSCHHCQPCRLLDENEVIL